MQSSKKLHLDVALHIQRYVKGTIGYEYKRSEYYDIVILIMQDITILEDQAPGICSSSVREQFLGIVKDNQQYHCQLQKWSTRND